MYLLVNESITVTVYALDNILNKSQPVNKNIILLKLKDIIHNTVITDIEIIAHYILAILL